MNSFAIVRNGLLLWEIMKNIGCLVKNITPRHVWISISSVPISIALGVFMGGVWWWTAFDWDPEAQTPFFAYIFFGLQILFFVLAVLAFLLSIAGGILLLLRWGIQKIQKKDIDVGKTDSAV